MKRYYVFNRLTNKVYQEDSIGKIANYWLITPCKVIDCIHGSEVLIYPTVQGGIQEISIDNLPAETTPSTLGEINHG